MVYHSIYNRSYACVRYVKLFVPPIVIQHAQSVVIVNPLIRTGVNGFAYTYLPAQSKFLTEMCPHNGLLVLYYYCIKNSINITFSRTTNPRPTK